MTTMGQQMTGIIDKAVAGDRCARDELRRFFLYHPPRGQEHFRSAPVDLEAMVKELPRLIDDWQRGQMDGVQFMYCVTRHFAGAYKEEPGAHPFDLPRTSPGRTPR